MLGKKIGVDLGTGATRLHVRGEGVVAVEPSLAAVEAGLGGDRGRAVAVGLAAREALRPGVELRHPLRAGAIEDRAAAEGLLQHLVMRACGRQRIFKPDVMVAVPPTLDGAERLFLVDVCAAAGARTAYLLDTPMAAALGCGLPAQSPLARMVVDAGAGTVEAAVIAHEGMVSWRSLRRGGAQLTADIARRLSESSGATVGALAAEDAKREIASAVALAEERTLRLTARRDGLETEVVVSSDEVGAAISGWLAALTSTVLECLEDTPARLRDQLREQTGLWLCGGGALLRGLDRHLGAATGLRVSLAPDPTGCAARGTGTALESLEVLRRSFLYVR